MTLFTQTKTCFSSNQRKKNTKIHKTEKVKMTQKDTTVLDDRDKLMEENMDKLLKMLSEAEIIEL